MSDRSAITGRVGSWIGLVGHLCTLPFFAASGLVAPLWAIIVLLVVWAALLAAAIWAVRARSPWGLLTPIVAIGVWFGTISAGEALLDWTA
ncbi:hypothetical protein J5X84_26645 [Streptosporangiaceae bacterium NEAU-GS5]|nr:hypothetical protein [Streptosporangiaceae bacterium NEAU-GS5]